MDICAHMGFIRLYFPSRRGSHSFENNVFGHSLPGDNLRNSVGNNHETLILKTLLSETPFRVIVLLGNYSDNGPLP